MLNVIKSGKKFKGPENTDFTSGLAVINIREAYINLGPKKLGC